MIVVGAGPAGSALACQLAPTRRVLLLEREPTSSSVVPRIGESLPGAARVLLTRLGVFERFVADAHDERGATISAWDDDAPVWFDSVRDPNGPGWHLDRARFDASLRRAAGEAGAVLAPGCGPLDVARAADGTFVVGDARGETYAAPVLVDASGRSASAVRQLGVTRRVLDELVCLYAHLPPTPADEDRSTRICIDRNGWWYSVRVPSGVRVLAFHLDADDPELKALREPGKLLDKARQRPLLCETLTRATPAPVHARVAGSSVVDLPGLRQITGLFAVGDASVSFDPIASQGLFHALASAMSAANAIQSDPRSEAQKAAPDLASRPTRSASRDAFIDELSAVGARYLDARRAVYGRAARQRPGAFWARRADGVDERTSGQQMGAPRERG